MSFDETSARAAPSTPDTEASLDLAPVPIFTLDAAGVIAGVNVAGAALLRRERGRLLGQPFAAFVRGDVAPLLVPSAGAWRAGGRSPRSSRSCSSAVTASTCTLRARRPGVTRSRTAAPPSPT